MPIYGYAMIRWFPGGHESFGGFFNSMIHVLMYSYYFLAALGPHMQKYLWWKRYLTTFQMIQFVIIFVKSGLVATGAVECGFPWQFSLISLAVMSVFFALFMDFYFKTYKSNKKTNKSN